MVSNSINTSYHFLITLDFIQYLSLYFQACEKNDDIFTMPHWLPSLEDDCHWFASCKNVDLSKFNPKVVFDNE